MGFVAGAVVVLLLSRRLGIIMTIAAVAIVLVLATSVESTFWTYFRRGQDQQLLESLSGRAKWWNFAWARFLERPLTGYGAYAGGRFAALAEMGDQTTSSVHNTYLEAILGIGILGIVPLLICLAVTWWRLLKVFLSRATNELVRNIGLEAAGVLMVITVRSFFTTDLILHPALPWLLVLGFGEFLRRQERSVTV
jgi:O-antigen ligase